MAWIEGVMQSYLRLCAKFYPFSSLLVAPLGALVLVMLARPFYPRTEPPETPQFPWKVWVVLTVVLFAVQSLGICLFAPRPLEK